MKRVWRFMMVMVMVLLLLMGGCAQQATDITGEYDSLVITSGRVMMLEMQVLQYGGANEEGLPTSYTIKEDDGKLTYEEQSFRGTCTLDGTAVTMRREELIGIENTITKMLMETEPELHFFVYEDYLIEATASNYTVDGTLPKSGSYAKFQLENDLLNQSVDFFDDGTCEVELESYGFYGTYEVKDKILLLNLTQGGGYDTVLDEEQFAQADVSYAFYIDGEQVHTGVYKKK